MADYAIPFQPGADMISLLGSSTNSGSATLINMPGPFTLMTFNRSGSFDAYLAYGPTSTAVASATMPAVGAGQQTGSRLLPLPARVEQPYTFSGPTFFGIVMPAGNAIVDLAPGNGE